MLFPDDHVDWLELSCPDFRLIAEVVDKNKTHTPPPTAQGGVPGMQLHYITDGAVGSSSSHGNNALGPDADYQPPARRRDAPAARKRKAGSQGGRLSSVAAGKRVAISQNDGNEGSDKPWTQMWYDLTREIFQYTQEQQVAERTNNEMWRQRHFDLHLKHDERMEKEYKLKLKDFEARAAQRGRNNIA